MMRAAVISVRLIVLAVSDVISFPYMDLREPSARNMRHMLASVVLRLLGSRVVHEVVEQSLFPMLSSSLKTDVDLSMEAFAASAVDLSGESIFNRLLLVLHGLLSSSRPRWLKSKKDFSVFDREVAESLQVSSLTSILVMVLVLMYNAAKRKFQITGAH